MSAEETLVVVGRVLRPHGVRGAVWVQSFCQNPADLSRYPLSVEGLPQKAVKRCSPAEEDRFLMQIEGVETRDQAELLRNRKVLTERSFLPPLQTPDEFYSQDLVGLTVENAETNEVIGGVSHVLNFGAGDVLEITSLSSPSCVLGMVPFHRDAIERVDLPARLIRIWPQFLV